MPDHPSAVSGVFGRPFAEQVAYFRRKLGNLVPTAAWDDMLGAAHDDGFMVAGAAKADLLADLAAAVDKAIAEGRGVEEFRRDFRAIVAKHGWTGWTGEGSKGGEAWRVKTILRTNASTSYAAGRHAQLVDGDFGFWIYRHGGSLEPRIVHLNWNGLALPPKHVFWKTHYPPSEWGCSCYVVGARTASMIKRLGGDPDKKLPGDWNAIDPATGAPVGIGKGWGYAPGASVSATVRALAPKVRHWDHAIAKAFMDSLPTASADALSDAYRGLATTADDAAAYARAIEAGREGDVPKVRTLGLIHSNQVATIAGAAELDIAGFDFVLDPSALRHVARKHGSDATEQPRGQRAVTADDYKLLPQILSAPDAIANVGTSDQGEPLIEYRKLIGGVRFVAVLAVRKGRRSLALKTLHIGAGEQ